MNKFRFKKVPAGYTNPVNSQGLHLAILTNLMILAIVFEFSLLNSNGEFSNTAILGLGIIGVWRHAWGVINYVRAILYGEKYEVLAKISNAKQQRIELAVVITFYNQGADIVECVVRSLYEVLCNNECEAYIVVAYKEESQVETVRDIVGDTFPILSIKQVGRGKREALADCLNLLSDYLPASIKKRCLTLFIDGDTIVSNEALNKSIFVLEIDRKIGAVVVNEVPFVSGGYFFRKWRLLRSLQRDRMMRSFSLSKRVLVLTGRFSLIRGDITLNSSFINSIRKDYVYDRDTFIPLLTGDDKSTWFEVLRRGFDMFYISSASIITLDSFHMDKQFLKNFFSLNVRYSGNMARMHKKIKLRALSGSNNHFRYGLFDQRISMWTSLLSPFFLILLLIFGPLSFFCAFLFYVLLIKNIQALAIFRLTGVYDLSFPYIMFFDQFFVSIVKVFAFTHLHFQAWNNQGISLMRGDGFERIRSVSVVRFVLQLSTFLSCLVSLYILIR